MSLASRLHGLTLSAQLSAAVAVPIVLTAATGLLSSVAPLVMAPVGCAVAAVLVRGIMRPFTRLAETIESFPVGGLAPIPAAADIGALARSFERIAAARQYDIRAREMFRSIVEACPSGMVAVDRGGVIVMLNAAIERMFGYERSELIGRPVEMLTPPRPHGEHGCWRADFLHHGEAARSGDGRRLAGMRKDGTEIVVEIGFNPIESHQLILGTITDISERRRSERLKDEFVSTVSHELRTPLTSISGSLGLLTGSAGGELPETAMRLLTIAHKNSQRLVRLINDILEIEKIESDEVAFEVRRVDAKLLVEQAIEASRVHSESLGVTIRLEPGAAGAVRADPDRLMQVVTNLLSNALKFSPAGEEVTVSMAQRENAVTFAIRDRGPGIPAEFRNRIFAKFAQGPGANARQKGGTGLGLSIVKAIVMRLGGSAGFSDAPGGGTIFSFDLPAWDGAETVPPQTVVRALTPEGEIA
jgi:PAS domain S-box-containing protein